MASGHLTRWLWQRRRLPAALRRDGLGAGCCCLLALLQALTTSSTLSTGPAAAQLHSSRAPSPIPGVARPAWRKQARELGMEQRWRMGRIMEPPRHRRSGPHLDRPDLWGRRSPASPVGVRDWGQPTSLLHPSNMPSLFGSI
jgi:hypothetical protein